MRTDRRGAALLAVILASSAGQAHAGPADGPTPAVVARWEALPIRERQRQRASVQAWWRMADADRARLREAAVAFAALDPASQSALRNRFAALDPGARHGWLLGPTLGYYYPRLQPLLGYVTEAERLPLLRCLQSMPPQELEVLVRLAFSTPPSRRAALRAELVRQAPARRMVWLLAQVER